MVSVLYLVSPFSSQMKHICNRGWFIFSSIYVPEQEAPPTEKYCFLLVFILLFLDLNVLQNMFTR